MDSFLIPMMVQEPQHQTATKKLHPFFSKDASSIPTSPLPLPPCHHDGSSSGSVGYDDVEDDRRKRRKTESPQEINGTDFLERSQLNRTQPNFQIPPNKAPGEGKAASIRNDLFHRPTPTPTPAHLGLSEDNDEHSLAQQSTQQNEATIVSDANESRKPLKVLKFNLRTGTLGSPPKPKQSVKPSRIVTMRYGADSPDDKARLGNVISRILEGSLQLPVTPTKKRVRRSRAKKHEEVDGQGAAASPAHPFFGGIGGKANSQPGQSKSQEATRPSAKPRNTIFLTTPISPRKPRSYLDASKIANFGSQRTGITKVPGAMHAMWPPQGTTHVLGEDILSGSSPFIDESSPPRKSKGQIVTVSRDEAVLSRVLDGLNLAKIRTELDGDDSFPTPPPDELRLPKRHFESGRKLRARIGLQLKSTVALRQNQHHDELAGDASLICHPAIASLYKSLEHSLSAYDRSTCESSAWTQKYAPVRATEVLQSSREAPLLKEWLEALKVQSVDTGANNSDGKTNSKQEKPFKKRKRNKLDGFIVDSDDDLDEISLISEDDDEDSSSEVIPLNKTVVRNSSKDLKEAGRLKNAVLLSGPNGCGKTAAVYAVARELDYEIFEINSSSRRSGKDLLERVGDMTRNHLVQQHRAEKAAAGSPDGDMAKEVQSGKQGMMTSFFKPKPATLEKAKQLKKTADKPGESAKSAAPKAQKQSLILVEEVDVLYKEDTQFWATLMSMISQSRRPFILTCNDESLVPVQSLALHGIFRFNPPPADLAVDLCLLVAANEGHALQRDAVEAAYASRGEDLRATLLDLNYWCQLGVGDRRGGFDWFLLRWPRGCDVDETGDTVRVVSENTYTKGMGWIGRDAIASKEESLDTDEEVMHQMWNLWQVPVDDWQRNVDFQPWAQDISSASRNKSMNLDSLQAYDDFCEAMSASDICSAGQFGSPFQQQIDATLPDLPNKARDDYIIGRQLLEADPACTHACPSGPISYCLASLARRSLLRKTKAACSSSAAAVLNPLTESSAVATLDEFFQQEPNAKALTRYDLSLAFDPLAISDRALINFLDPSVFDRTFRLIVLDVAPWVRGIVSYDNRLMQERSKLSSLLSEGGNGKGRKRMRTTRAALSALEGGERKSTRGEKWFKGVGTGLVMRTGGADWAEAARAELEEQCQLGKMGMESGDLDMDMVV